MNKFAFTADAPNLSKIPDTEIIGVTVVLLSCAYDEREFVRVGYYVNNEYTDEALMTDPPAKPILEKVRRNILAEKPRVTRFAIKWSEDNPNVTFTVSKLTLSRDSEESAPAEFPPEQPEVDAAEDDEGAYAAGEEEDEEVLAEDETKADDEDAQMEGTEQAATADVISKEDDNASDAGSEDLEAESSEEDEEGEEEDEEEVEGEQEADDEMDTAEDGQKAADHAQSSMPQQQQQQHQDVMVH